MIAYSPAVSGFKPCLGAAKSRLSRGSAITVPSADPNEP
ncbi:hypothetical protein SAMCCGM7_Ch0094 [Sinorhizobium americanum CCGM7]|nr:hypothetical protein SAMCCGM7_Ch0094 [Sinorhizobium americanum CCGM7]